MRKFFNDEAGFVISAELVLVLTIAVLAMSVGLTVLRDAINQEWNDLADAFGAVSQSYNVSGNLKEKSGGLKPNHAVISGFGYNDEEDDCDCADMEVTDVCGKDDGDGNGTPE